MELKKNIAIITTSLAVGGAEKAAAIQSRIIASLNCNVIVISMLNEIDYKFKGELINLGQGKPFKENVFQKVIRTIKFWKVLQKFKPDLIIDNRMRSNSITAELVLSKFVYKTHRVAYVLHSFDLPEKIVKFPFILKSLYKEAFKIITVSNKTKRQLKHRHELINVKTIYNAYDENTQKDNQVQLENLNYRFILYFGRLEEKQKNLKFLIKAYSKSKLKSEGIKLIMLGNGIDKDMLKCYSKEVGRNTDIVFKPFVNNPYSLVRKALFTVLTSNYEGFPLSIIESLACGTPVVSVNCIAGPSESITHKYNGLLIDVNNLNSFVDALNLMREDKILYRKLKSNAKTSVDAFSEIEIKKEWVSLIKEIED